MCEKIRVVPAEEAHLEALARLERLCFSTPWSEQALREGIREPSSVFFTALLGKTPVSYTHLAPALADAALCSLLCGVLAGKIEEYGMHSLLCGIEIPLSEVLVDMEQRGFLVDTAGIRAFGEMLTARIASLETAIYEYTGEININSPKQLGTALFETLGLPTGKKTKSGYSTGAQVLERIRYAHPVVDMILEYRTLTKLSSTYVEGLLKVAGEAVSYTHLDVYKRQVFGKRGLFLSVYPRI